MACLSETVGTPESVGPPQSTVPLPLFGIEVIGSLRMGDSLYGTGIGSVPFLPLIVEALMIASLIRKFLELEP